MENRPVFFAPSHNTCGQGAITLFRYRQRCRSAGVATQVCIESAAMAIYTLVPTLPAICVATAATFPAKLLLLRGYFRPLVRTGSATHLV